MPCRRDLSYPTSFCVIKTCHTCANREASPRISAGCRAWTSSPSSPRGSQPSPTPRARPTLCLLPSSASSMRDDPYDDEREGAGGKSAWGGDFLSSLCFRLAFATGEEERRPHVITAHFPDNGRSWSDLEFHESLDHVTRVLTGR